MEALNATLADSWSGLVQRNVELASGTDDGWVKVKGRKTLNRSFSKSIVVDQKTFEFSRGFLGSHAIVRCSEKSRNFFTYCDIDLEGIAWLSLLLRQEFGHELSSERRGWKCSTKLGSLLARRERNTRGEFFRIFWSVRGRTFRPIVLPEGLDRCGWRSISETLLAVIADFNYKGKVILEKESPLASEFRAPPLPLDTSLKATDLRAKINESRFGCWNHALVVSVKSCEATWTEVGSWIGQRFALDSAFELFPFSSKKAIFFADNKQNMERFCANGDWSIEGRKISINRWSPNANGVSGEIPSKWLLLEGVPFHCWTPAIIRSILEPYGSVLEIAEASLKLYDLSGIRVRLSGWSEGILFCFMARAKDCDFLVRASVFEDFQNPLLSEFTKITVQPTVPEFLEEEEGVGESIGGEGTRVTSGCADTVHRLMQPVDSRKEGQRLPSQTNGGGSATCGVRSKGRTCSTFELRAVSEPQLVHIQHAHFPRYEVLKPTTIDNPSLLNVNRDGLFKAQLAVTNERRKSLGPLVGDVSPVLTRPTLGQDGPGPSLSGQLVSHVSETQSLVSILNEYRAVQQNFENALQRVTVDGKALGISNFDCNGSFNQLVWNIEKLRAASNKEVCDTVGKLIPGEVLCGITEGGLEEDDGFSTADADDLEPGCGVGEDQVLGIDGVVECEFVGGGRDEEVLVADSRYGVPLNELSDTGRASSPQQQFEQQLGTYDAAGKRIRWLQQRRSASSLSESTQGIRVLSIVGGTVGEQTVDNYVN